MYGLSTGSLLVLYDRLGSSSRQDGNNIGQDGKCNRQPVAINDRTLTKWPGVKGRIQSHGVIFDILRVHRDKQSTLLIYSKIFIFKNTLYQPK